MEVRMSNTLIRNYKVFSGMESGSFIDASIPAGPSSASILQKIQE
jgi:hypothetical protein